MRKLILLVLGMFSIPYLSHSQSNSTQLPNGVIVHHTQGVEGATKLENTEVHKARSIQDLTLAECIDALPFLEMKLNEVFPSDREYYLQERDLLIKRINELKAAN